MSDRVVAGLLGIRAISTLLGRTLGQKPTEPIASACDTREMPTADIPNTRLDVSGSRPSNGVWPRDLRC